MEIWEYHRSQRNIHNNNKNNSSSRDQNPSFSSSLLDYIYRSIDESQQIEQTMSRKKHSSSTTTTTSNTTRVSNNSHHGVKAEEEEIMSLRRACLIEKWMEKKAAAAAEAAAKDKVVLRRNSMADFDKRLFVNSSSSSSYSSSGGGFSSASESADSMRSRSASSSSCYTMPRQPKTIRTSLSSTTHQQEFETSRHQKSKTKQESSTSGFVKTNKSRALKIYGDLKKVKQPISPGGKLATFLNSIFNNGKKHNKINIDDLSDRNSKSTMSNGSNCSSASSYSRSCLRNGSVSRGEISNESAKRSVRFYPVSVIFNEDCRPCGHKTPEEIKINTTCFVMEDEDDHRRKVEEVARSYLMKNYNQIKKKTSEDEEMGDVEDEDEEDDAASYASSDLFELDMVGVEERYREELPVYETTYLDRNNRAIANA